MRISLIPIVLLLTGCSDIPSKTISNAVVESVTVPIQPRPRAVNLVDVKFNVVNSENIEEFLSSITVGDEFVFIAMGVRDYERLSLNVDELRRYIEQQNSVILFYEENLKNAK